MNRKNKDTPDTIPNPTSQPRPIDVPDPDPKNPGYDDSDKRHPHQGDPGPAQ